MRQLWTPFADGSSKKLANVETLRNGQVKTVEWLLNDQTARSMISAFDHSQGYYQACISGGIGVPVCQALIQRYTGSSRLNGWFVHACRAGATAVAAYMLENKDTLQVNPNVQTGCMVSIQCSHERTLHYLLEQAASKKPAEAAIINECELLEQACQYPPVNCLELLLHTHKFDPLQAQARPVAAAVRTKSPGSIRAVLQVCAHRLRWGMVDLNDALVAACGEAGHAALVSMLLDLRYPPPVDTSHPDCIGRAPPPGMVCSDGSVWAVNPSYLHCLPLRQACQIGNVQAVDLLLRAGGAARRIHLGGSTVCTPVLQRAMAHLASGSQGGEDLLRVIMTCGSDRMPHEEEYASAARAHGVGAAARSHASWRRDLGNRPRAAHALLFRRAHEARRDAALLHRCCGEGRPLELAKRLRVGRLALGPGRLQELAEVARAGGHDECVRVIQIQMDGATKPPG